jgi:hypothetical protein
MIDAAQKRCTASGHCEPRKDKASLHALKRAVPAAAQLRRATKVMIMDAAVIYIKELQRNLMDALDSRGSRGSNT